MTPCSPFYRDCIPFALGLDLVYIFLMKSVLFVDFDGTICHDKFWRSLSSNLSEKLQRYIFSSDKSLVEAWMKGLHTSEEINRMVADELNIKYDFLWDIFVNDAKSMFVSQSVLQKIGSLREKYIVILITDNMDSFDRFTLPSLKLQNYFDVVVNSYSRGVSKNENGGRLFVEVAKENNSKVSGSMLIDNSKDVCQLFESLGGQSLFVTKESSVSYWLDKIKLNTEV